MPLGQEMRYLVISVWLLEHLLSFSVMHAGQQLPMPQASREHSGENRVAEQTPLAEAGDLVSKAPCGPSPFGTTCSHIYLEAALDALRELRRSGLAKGSLPLQGSLSAMEAGAGRSGAFHVVGSAAQLAPEPADAELRRLQQEVGPAYLYLHLSTWHLWQLHARVFYIILPQQ